MRLIKIVCTAIEAHDRLYTYDVIRKIFQQLIKCVIKQCGKISDPDRNISTDITTESTKYARESENTREFYQSHLDLRPRASAWTQEGLPGRESYMDRDPRVFPCS